MNADQLRRLLKDASLLATSFVTQNPGTMIASVVALIDEAILLLPPIDAPELDPGDRAAADKEAADLEAAKFGK